MRIRLHAYSTVPAAHSTTIKTSHASRACIRVPCATVARARVSVVRLLKTVQRSTFTMAVVCHRVPQVTMRMTVGCVTSAMAYAPRVHPNTIVSRVLSGTFMTGFAIVRVRWAPLPIRPLTPVRRASCRAVSVSSSPLIVPSVPTRCSSIKELVPRRVLLAPTKTMESVFLATSLAFSVKAQKLV
jgi:hypothetical protein